MEQVRGREEEEEEEEHNNSGFHVLAVDDSSIDRMILQKLLTLFSYNVTCVESGDKALEYLGLVDHTPHIQSQEIDDGQHKDSTIRHSPSPSDLPDNKHGQRAGVNLIMTDYSMPGMNGYDLLKRIKRSFWKDVPVVVMSSENVPSRIHMCMEGGADGFLLKPLTSSDLSKLLPIILKSATATTASGAASSSNLKVNDDTNHDYQHIVIEDTGVTEVDDA